MSRNFDFAVFIGRFQPFHNGHLHGLSNALHQADRVILLLGSAWQPRSLHNPWTHQERENMVRACLSEHDNQRLSCLPLEDVPESDDIWVQTVNAIVANLSAACSAPRITLVGHHKDATGFYLDLFPQWARLNLENHLSISATPIRMSYFSASTHDAAKAAVKALNTKDMLPGPVADWLRDFVDSHDFSRLHHEAMMQAIESSRTADVKIF
uniref:adenylyltransferase/cytidyltransferase family protein n=1 Tax=Halomonas sp. TaxID=1486246 RepID=UPI00261FDE23|nr:adenylyltransferase/cytidyltransferase family protein [Halomonas sp.]